MLHLATRHFISSISTLNRALCSSVLPSNNLSGHPHQVDLYDSFNRRHNYLRISLTEKCNLRCTYCMPAEGVQLTPKEQLLTSDEIVRLATIFVTQLGVNKIRLTGGEPMVSKDFTPLVEKLGELKKSGLDILAITTNGLKLSRRVAHLKQLGVDAVNISLDTLDANKFMRITRRNALPLVMAAIDASLDANLSHPVKINCVVMRSVNLDEVTDFVALTKNKPLDVRFIEYMPFDGNSWSNEQMVPGKELMSTIECKLALPLVPVVNAYNGKTDTAKSYRVPGHLGTIGFISSMTDAFCHSCNRLRITADGCLKVCLFDKNEVSLKHHLRHGSNDQQVQQVIQSALKTKKAKHAGEQKTRPLAMPSLTSLASLVTLYAATTHMDKRPSLLAIRGRNQAFKRSLSHFTHLNECDEINMVDITNKKAVLRLASATATVDLGASLISLIKGDARSSKGNVITTAKLAGVQGAKVTSSLIPLCHQIPLSVVHVDITLTGETAEIICSVRATHNTGVEMEALTGASIAALTIYDMCKAINKNIVIREVKLLKKEKMTT